MARSHGGGGGNDGSNGFWRPGDNNPQLLVNSYDAKANEQLINLSSLQFNPLHHLSLQQQRRQLPVFRHREQLLFCVENYATTILVGETGSGKTTQVPQFLYEANWCNTINAKANANANAKDRRMIVCTQPRRIAAMTIAERVAKEMNTPLGKKVGYAVRFDENWDPHETCIKFCTDGMLLRETMVDPLLTRYSVILLDEAHERNLETDVLLGLIKKIQKRRPELRVVVASATLHIDTFVRFFRNKKRKLPPSSSSSAGSSSDPQHPTQQQLGDVVAINVEGRQYPVDIEYLKEPASDFLEKSIETALAIDRHEGPGDILIFLPGQEEIDFVVRSLSERAPAHLLPMPFYATLPFAMQQRVFLPAPVAHARKVIVATTIAETSVTLHGVSFVIDCCFTKLAFFNPLTGVESLLVTQVSKASAKQRAGRAGRIAPGKCFRLCTEQYFQHGLADETIPQMQRTNLSLVVLHLLSMGIQDLVHFDFVSPPSAEALARALETLFALGAIDPHCRLSEPLGTQMAEFPLDPSLARVLLAALEYGKECVDQALTVASMLSVDDVLIKARGGSRSRERQQEILQSQATLLDPRGDHLTLLKVFDAFQDNGCSKSWCDEHFVSFRALTKAKEVRKQLKRYLFRFGNVNGKLTSTRDKDLDDPDDPTPLLKCIVTGFFANAARLDANGTYRTVRDGRLVQVHPTSVFYSHGRSPDWVVFHQSVLTTQEFVRHVTQIDPRWLVQVAPHFYRTKEVGHALSGDSGALGLPKFKPKPKLQPKPQPQPKPAAFGTTNPKQKDKDDENDDDLSTGRILFRKPTARAQPKLPVHIGKSKGGLRSQF